MAQADRIERSEEEWREQLTPAEYEVLRRSATEPPGTGALLHNRQTGMYVCAGCGAELFSSQAKFDSATGWPSFTEPAIAEAVELHEDMSHMMRRTEVRCRRCGGHLGHVFDDGPGDGGPPTQRFCINSAALHFRARD